ncbi:hypothetical protein FA15DRAFT_68206 [Coprinopsis marcescibilis]|uniref:Uncharacterized protein n=1 Tax=Coprinopsis marcescibilis TaxID=230819 RepID=A0A5C3KMX2_COPMA|nr:hypothetical protein FA15DRAFT_68206 [Coprinopsis marcescibilis]
MVARALEKLQGLVQTFLCGASNTLVSSRLAPPGALIWDSLFHFHCSLTLTFYAPDVTNLLDCNWPVATVDPTQPGNPGSRRSTSPRCPLGDFAPNVDPAMRTLDDDAGLSKCRARRSQRVILRRRPSIPIG